MVKKAKKTKVAAKVKSKPQQEATSFKLNYVKAINRVFGQPIKIPTSRVVWPYIVEPREDGVNKQGEVIEGKYEIVSVCNKKNPEVKATLKYLEEMAGAMVDLYNKYNKTKVTGFEVGDDGDAADHEKYPYYKNSVLISAKNKKQPTVIGTKKKNGKAIPVDPEAIVGGVECALVVTPHFAANGGLSFKLNVVQLVADDGTRFGGSISTTAYSSLLDLEDAEEDDEEVEEPAEEEEEELEEEEEEDEEEDSESEDEEDSDDNEDDSEEDDSEDEDDDDEEDDSDDEDDDSDDEDDEEDDDDEDDDEEDEVEDIKPKKRGRPAGRKKAIDVL